MSSEATTSDQETAELLDIVYVEDDDDNFLLTKRVLESTGLYALRWARDGEEGLQMIREQRPVLVLLDLDVPKLDGFELARALRDDPTTATIPLVAVSANVMNREKQRAKDCGCDAFVEKPVDIVLLREIVAKMIAGD